MVVLTVDTLNTFPIKSARGFGLGEGEVRDRGFAHDRRWLVVDEDNNFITQRECSALATIDPTVTPTGLQICVGEHCIDVKTPITEKAERVSVVVWRDTVAVLVADPAVNDFVSSVLGQLARLVFMDAEAVRQTSGHEGAAGAVSFADGFPFLITTTASLGALNEAIVANGGEPSCMDRFRANIVINNQIPWDEDFWRLIQIGDVAFRIVKPCRRCVVTTKDQQTGASTGPEPLSTLSKIRRSDHPDLNGVLFGWNAIPVNNGVIRPGDVMTVLESRNEGWPIAAS